MTATPPPPSDDDAPAPDPAIAEPETVGLTTTAHEPGKCTECKLPIVIGQTIIHLEPTKRRVHAFCWTAA